MFGLLSGRAGRRNGHATVELPPVVPPIVTVSTPLDGAGRAVAEAVARFFDMRVLDVDAGSEQLAGPIKETLAYLWDSPELLRALLGSLSRSDAEGAGRPAQDVLFDLAARSGVVVVGARAGEMLRHRPEAFHVRVGPPGGAPPTDGGEVAYHLLIDLEMLPMDTSIDLVVAASRSHARRLPAAPQAGPPAESPDAVLEALARALQSEIAR